MLFKYHAVGTDLNGFPNAGTKPLSEFSVIELWSALQCKLDPGRYREFHFKDDLLLDTLEQGHQAYRDMSINWRARAEALLNESRVRFDLDRERLHNQCLSLVREYNEYHARFLERIREVGCFSDLIDSTFVRLTDEQWEEVAALRRERQAADSTASSQA